LVGKSGEKRLLEGSRRRWEDTVVMDPKEVNYEEENFLTGMVSINFS
jgi:hypothetical protein